MDPFLLLILLLFVAVYAFETAANTLNLKNFRPELPAEFVGVYDVQKYARSLEYVRTNTRFDLIQNTVALAALILFIVFGGFNRVDVIARAADHGLVITALAYAGILSALSWLLGLPFSLYHTFVIEERFGFNKMTWKTYLADTLKGALLGALIGAPLYSALVLFFGYVGPLAWLYSWILLTVVQLLIMFVAPVVIMPLFNKFSPLPEGPLKQAIEDFARGQHFKLSGIFTMDGSRRSTKANAFFTGFGRFRRIVLFDTLVGKHTLDELVAILAHEIGHYKRGHIIKSTALSILSSAVLLYTLSFFLRSPSLFHAFGMQNVSIYAGIIFASLVYSPILRILSIATNGLSRKFEYEADSYAVQTYGRPEALIDGLKKLSVDNLSHLTPHRLKVLLDYSHPPILLRIKALREARPSSL